MSTIAILLLASLAAGGPLQTVRTVQVDGVCPTEAPGARRNLNRFLTAPELAEDRAKVGLSQTTTGQARILSDALDAAVCTQLNEAFAAGAYGASPYRRTYYEAGGLYFVTITQERIPGKPFRMGHAPPIVVFSRDLQPLNL